MPRRGFCNCYCLKKHDLLEKEKILTKRTAKRILSYSSSDDECLPIKCSRTVKNSAVSDDKVTILSNVRVNFNEKQLKALSGGTKRFNISSCNISEDFKDFISISNNCNSYPNKNYQVPSTSGSVQHIQKRKTNFFLHLSDTDDESL